VSVDVGSPPRLRSTLGGDSAAAVPAPRAAGAVHAEKAGGRFLWILLQLVLVLLVVARFQIENEAFVRLTALTIGGFAVHYFLPLQHRLPFFTALSLAGIVMVLGLESAAWLVGLGLGLIGIAHLRVNVYVRAGILVAVGAALAVPRWGMGDVPWSAAVWPVLGSMFVFRMLSYLYDRSHGVEPKSISQTLAYFFLLPNVCFPLFPLIDFKRFCRGYYDAERHQIYQVGVEWIWRGVVQLILYRLVYFHLTLDPVAVNDVADLAAYMLSTFLLYVRLSGYFHIVIGMLHLFGFNLPETHHRYFLASSFTDFWRRINIYWKDFMLKVFYYPVFFRLRKLGETRALVIATIFTFVATWLLHMVQWFWIRGSVLVEWNDIAFWSLFASLVLVNSVQEAKRGRTRTAQKRDRRLAESASLVLRTIGTFATICVMWSLWTAESTTDWVLMLRQGMRLPSWTVLQTTLLVLGIAGGVGLWVYGVWKGWGAGQRSLGPRTSPLTICATSVVLAIATIPQLTAAIGGAGEVIDTLRLASSAGLNRRDAEDFQRGYYENLLDVGKFNRELQRNFDQRPADFVTSLSALGMARATNDEQDYEMLPNQQGRFMGAMLTTNQWGFRGKPYPPERPAGTFRLALVGPSTAMGSGVEDHETFASVLEERFNKEPVLEGVARYEVLNFGVAGYAPLQVLHQLPKKVFGFDPHAILYIGHAIDLDRTASRFVTLIRRRVVPADPFLQDLAARAELAGGMGPTEARRRLSPYSRELLHWVYSRIVAESRERGVQPIFAYLETVTEPMEPWRAAQRTEVLALARKAGFHMIDLTGVYEPYEPDDLWILKNDAHPNVLGNRLIGTRLHEALQANRLFTAMAAR
jgi:D-alanyl-lipoteichoic acid acyltransferase DltB (MBOAT superfamily)